MNSFGHFYKSYGFHHLQVSRYHHHWLVVVFIGSKAVIALCFVESKDFPSQLSITTNISVLTILCSLNVIYLGKRVFDFDNTKLFTIYYLERKSILLEANDFTKSHSSCERKGRYKVSSILVSSSIILLMKIHKDWSNAINGEVIFDPVNMLDLDNVDHRDEVFQEAIELIGPDIAMVHFKDFIRVDEGYGLKSVGAGTGEMDYTAILTYLKKEKPFVYATLENTTPENAAWCVEQLKNQYDRIEV